MVDEKRGPHPGTPQARHGGEAVKRKYGAKFYAEIGRKGGEACGLISCWSSRWKSGRRDYPVGAVAICDARRR